ncbi:MAG: T9SS type A sorting domain-containing protein [Bacteroidales bacterium]|nr:T9SS type A sorting domain-containing protein [Bacteroidales bacterium]
MKKYLVILLMLFAARFAYADSILFDSFEYANHDGETPTGWVCDDDSWVCGYLEKDHNRIAHSGNWYAYTNSAESWMFMSMYMSEQLKYRFTLWAISDGDYQLEIWAGNEASSGSMTQLLLNEIVSSGSYEKFSAYIDEMTTNYQYFGIHAVSAYGDCILTIDDVNVDMVDKYGMQVTPASIETNMAPGTQTEFCFKFTNIGYESLIVYITPLSDYFSDIHLWANGVEGPTFPAAPNETVEINGVATLLPDVTIGSPTWIDIMFTLDCGCATAMFTFWATPGYESIDEYFTNVSIYPNPSSGNITIEGNGEVFITNALGQTVLTKEITERETITLPEGIYFVTISGKTQKLIVK